MLVKKSSGSARMLSIDRVELLRRLDRIVASMRVEFREVVEVILFGSFARGDYTARSDVDVIIVVSSALDDPLQRILKFRKLFDIPLPIDVLVYTEGEIKEAMDKKNSFIRKALDEGIRL